MAIANRRVYVTDGRGTKRLVATPGDVIPEGVPSSGVPEQRVDPPSAAVEPLEGYDALSEAAVLALLADLSDEELAAVQAYERTHQARGAIHDYDRQVAVVVSADATPDTTAETPEEPVTVPAESVTAGYESLSKAKLEAEVARRNGEREDGDAIEVSGNGTKADLITALQADDAKSDEG